MKKVRLITAIAASVAVLGTAVTLIVLYRDEIVAFLSNLTEKVKSFCPCCGGNLPEEYEDFADVDEFGGAE